MAGARIRSDPHRRRPLGLVGRGGAVALAVVVGPRGVRVEGVGWGVRVRSVGA